MMRMNNLSIGKKLVLFGIIGTAIPLILLGEFCPVERPLCRGIR